MATAVLDRPPEDEAECEVWRDFFDTKKTSIESALGHFQIDVDPKGDDPDGEEDVVPYELFTLRPRQVETLDWIERYFWKLKNRAARIICLKSRRYGMSTFYMLLGLERILRVAGYQVLLIAQDDASARRHFQRLRDTFAQIPRWILKERGIEVIKDTDSQLILRHEGHKTSEFHVAPAKRNAIGRGARYNFIIVTEFPHYPKSAKRDLSGVLATCRNVRGNITVFEATAKGFEEFHRRYVRAAKKRSDYRAQFIAAFEHPGNRKKFDSPEDEDAFLRSIGTVADVGIEDELVLFRRLTVDLRWTPRDALEHLNWRRTEIMDTCEGVLDFYHRENPNTSEEAFSGTGMPLFPKAILEAWRPYAEAREERAERGRLVVRGDKVVFQPDRRGDLTVFEPPDPARRYAFGADVASGIAVHADGKTEADWSPQLIKDVVTKISVARFRAHIPPAEYAEQLFLAAVWFNGARGYIERAINDSGVCIDRFIEQELGDFYGADLLLSQRRDIKTDAASVAANYKYTPGFQTTSKTKPRLISKIDQHIKAVGLPDGVKPCPWDLIFIDEAGRYERDEQTGRTEAAEGFDDMVMTEGMSLEAIDRDAEDAPTPEEPPAPTSSDPGWAILMRHSAGVRAQQQEGEERVAENEVSGMPGY